jgi:hypothetical protein
MPASSRRWVNRIEVYWQPLSEWQMSLLPGTLAGPRRLVHGERESFIGGYRWQRSGAGGW